MVHDTQHEFFFEEPRFQMTAAGRSLVRIVTRITYATLIAIGIVFAFFVPVPFIRSIGLFVLLFIAHRVWRWRFPAYRLNVRLPQKVNIADYFSGTSYRMLELVYDRSLLVGGDFYLHLMSRLLQDHHVKSELGRLDVDVKAFGAKIDEHLGVSLKARVNKKTLLSQLDPLVRYAFDNAYRSSGMRIEPHNLFGALGLLQDKSLNKLFALFEIDPDQLVAVFLATNMRARLRASRGGSRLVKGVGARRNRVKHHVMNRAWTARTTPMLDRFSTDLTDLAIAGGIEPMVGHEEEFKRLVDVLARPGNPHALLIGESSSEQDALVGELARHVVHGNVPAPLYDKRFVSISIGSLMAGAAEGELEQRMKQFITDIRESGNIIVHIPDIHNLVRTSGDAHASAADIFLPAIRHNEFSVVGSTFPREFKQYLDVDHKFVEQFEIIRLSEMTEEDAVTLLVRRAIILEVDYNITISLKAITESVKLARKYLREKMLPDSAYDLLKEAVVMVVEQKDKKVTPDHIIKLVETKARVPIHEAGVEEVEQLLHLEEIIHKKYIDQEEAVQAVAQSLREYRAGLTRKDGPIASFLFVGPTGVGKTELAKLLAEFQFGSDSLMLRYDMSEYQTKESIGQILGTANGEIRGGLTDAVREKPYALVLLDEFEKAHPDILNLFLQVFDDGRLTDALERTIDFRNTIIIATSNAHSDIINDALGKSETMEQISEYLKRRLVDVFKPELLNRFSRIIAFKNLSPNDIRAIAVIKLTEMQSRLQDEQGIGIEYDDEAVKKIAQVGFDPLFGARPLRKAIDDEFRGKLAELILKKELEHGDTVRISVENETFTFSVEKAG
jgi:ATP-dependent Clp protease ATP-binding subunit ClpC